MEDEFLPDGGIAQKVASNPRLTGVDKIGCIAVNVPDPPDPESVKLLRADNFSEALTKLNIVVNLSIPGMDGSIEETPYRLTKPQDLLEKGMVAQIPILQELDQRQQDLHRLHENLTNSFRTQAAFEKLFAHPTHKDEFVAVLEQAAAFFLHQDNKIP